MTNATYTPPPYPCSIIVIQTTGQLGKKFEFGRKDWCVLGANEDCDIVVPFPGVAQLQALVHVRRNGVFLQGIDKLLPVRLPRLQKQLINEEEIVLLGGDIFLLGERKFLIEYNAENAISDSIRNNISCAQKSKALGHTSKSPRKETPRLRTLQKKRRKSSLVVGEFDERYVLPRSGSEKLLSKTQLARISQSEQDILPEGDADRTQNDRQSISRQVTSTDDSQEEIDLSCSSSSDESTVLSDHNDNVSRNIDFSTIDNNLPALECNWKQADNSFSNADKKVSSRERKELVFARLSKGLSATPRRGETTSLSGRADAIVQKSSGYSLSADTKAFTGKENVPQLYPQLPKSSEPKDGTQGLDVSDIRSPLSNRHEIENQMLSSVNRHKTDASLRHIRGERSDNSSMQTPRGRSVAFASTIELAPGAHYSPFRPKEVANVSKSISKSESKKQSGRLAGSVRTNRRQGRVLVRSQSHKQKQTHPTKSDEHVQAPISSSEGLETLFSKKIPRDGSHRSSQPAIEYEDDSNPPTPSSTDEGPDTMVPQIPEVPGPSPMARVGGALAGFLKRLSGALESEEEDESSPEADDMSSHNRRSLGKLEENSSVSGKSSSEPVMSASEVTELSRCISPEHRKEFVAQIDSAAEDMRQAMHPVSGNLVEDRSCSSRETLVTGEATQDVFSKDEGESADPLVLAEGHPAENSLNGYHFASKIDMPCEEERNVRQHPMNTELGYEDCSEQTGSCENNPCAPETVHLGTGEYSTNSETEEEAGICEGRSTSLETDKDTNSISESADLEIEELFRAGANGMSQPDFRSEESEGDELDYGDEEDETSMESPDREVAAIVADDNENVVLHLRLGDNNCSDVKDHEDEEAELERSGELKGTGTPATEAAKPMPIPSFTGESSDSMERQVSLGEQPCSESDNIKADSTLALDGMAENVQNNVASHNVLKTRVSLEVNKNSKVLTERNESNARNRPENDQDALSGGIHEVEDKVTQIAMLRKELSRLKKDELKARLVSHELDESGLKKDLVERLALHMSVEAALAENGQSKENSDTPLGQTTDKMNAVVLTTSESTGTHVTPKKQTPHLKPAEVDSTVQEAQTMVRRSARKSRANLSSKVSTEKLSSAKSLPAKTSHVIEQTNIEPQTEVVSETEVSLSLYRRRTVKELRQFLKDRDLDIQQKMRKEELIQHLVTLSIGCDGQNLSAAREQDESRVEEANDPRGEPEQPLGTGSLKSYQKMTVMQLRAHLKERDQCQAGNKKALLERVSSRPERRTRSRRTVDKTSCLSCQMGKACEADITR